MSEAELHFIRARLRGGHAVQGPPRRAAHAAAGRAGLRPRRQGRARPRRRRAARHRATCSPPSPHRLGPRRRQGLPDDGLLFPARHPHRAPQRRAGLDAAAATGGVLRMLHNPRYAGAFVYGRRRETHDPDGKTHRRDPAPRPVDRAHPRRPPRLHHLGPVRDQPAPCSPQRRRPRPRPRRRSRPRRPRPAARPRRLRPLRAADDRALPPPPRRRRSPTTTASARVDPDRRPAAARPSPAPASTPPSASCCSTPSPRWPSRPPSPCRPNSKHRADEADRAAPPPRRTRPPPRRPRPPPLPRRRPRQPARRRQPRSRLERRPARNCTTPKTTTNGPPAAAGRARPTSTTARIRALAADFPALWTDPATPQRERKRMARLLLDDVTLAKTDQIHLHVRFRGGQTTSLTVPIPPTGWQARQTDPDTLAAARPATRRPHRRRGRRRPQRRRAPLRRPGKPFTRQIVLHLRRAHQLPSHAERLRAAGLLTLDRDRRPSRRRTAPPSRPGTAPACSSPTRPTTRTSGSSSRPPPATPGSSNAWAADSPNRVLTEPTPGGAV